MTTLLLTHPVFLEHDTGPGHPERPDRMRAIDKVLAHEIFQTPMLAREEAPLRDDVLFRNRQYAHFRRHDDAVVAGHEERHQPARDRDAKTRRCRREDGGPIRSQAQLRRIRVEEQRRHDVGGPHGEQQPEPAAC